MDKASYRRISFAHLRAGLLLLILTKHIVGVQSQFLEFPSNQWNWHDWSWGKSGTNEVDLSLVTTTPSSPDSSLPFSVWRWYMPQGGGTSFYGHAYTSIGYTKYETLTLWVQGTSNNFVLKFGSTQFSSPDVVIHPAMSPDLPVLPDRWTKWVIPLKDFSDRSFDRLQIENWEVDNTILYFAGFFGLPDGRTYKPLQDLPIPSGLTYEFLTVNQTYGGHGDQGLACEWYCDFGNPPYRAATDLYDIPIYAYRDTTIGPLAMQISANAYFTSAMGGWTFPWIFKPISNITRYIVDYPNLLMGCSCHNADYFEIGDPSKANYTLVAWVPKLDGSLSNAIMAYTSFVKEKNQTVAVIIRTRVPNQAPFYAAMEYTWVQAVEPNCTRTDLKGLCPDHIWFKDGQMGAMHMTYDRLQPLTALNNKYFKDTGYDISYDILPALDKILYYSGDYYGVPVSVTIRQWHIHRNAVDWLHSKGLRAPPPIDRWGSAWWESWDMKQFNKMVDTLYYDGNFTNIVPPASDLDNTPHFQYIVFGWGATMLNGTGRCGLDEYAVRAVNETYAHWFANEGMMQPRVPYAVDQNATATFEKWKQAAPLENPWEEPLFSMMEGDVSNYPDHQPVFALVRGYSSDEKYYNYYYKIYPPTKLAQIVGVLAGLARTARDPVLAHEALMVAIARNERFQANTAIAYDPTWTSESGVSGYTSALSLPDYLSIRRNVSDEQFLKHAAFAGYPVQQYPSYGLVQPYDPMNLFLNEIQYKNMSIVDAMARACKTINYATMPPCGPDNWEAYIVDDPKTNKANIQYRWKANATSTCRQDVPKAKLLPTPIVAATALTYTSTQSGPAKGMIGLMTVGILYEATLATLFLVKRDAQVIRAASRVPSQLIFFGGILTLASVIMRVTNGDKPQWFQCYGTYWAFAIGFGLVLGSLAMKSCRIHTIFNSKTAVKFSDFKLLCYIGLIVLGEIIFCLMYQFWLSESSGIKEADIPGLGITLEQQDCPTTHQAAVICLYIYNVALILLAAFYAFRTRNTISAFNESIFTASAIALICVITIVIVPVLSMISSPQAIFMLIALGTFIATVLSTSIFAIPKVLMAFGIMQGRDINETLKSNVSPGKSTMPTKFGAQSSAASAGQQSSTGTAIRNSAVGRGSQGV